MTLAQVMAAPELDRLLRVLEERDIDLDRDDIAWAFQSPRTLETVTSWIHNCLSPATLLTREELVFHEGRHGATEVAEGGSLLSDEDFESAIHSLEASTASIERQSKLLEAQKRALLEIQNRNSGADYSDSAKAHCFSKLARDKARTELEVAELEDSLLNHLEQSLKQAESATTSIQPSVDRVLEKDDRLLDGLEKVLPQISLASDADGVAEEVDRLCQALTVYSSAEIHTRIDAAFDAGSRIHMTQANGTHSQDPMSQREALRAELEELCREIDGLSAMAVDNQFRNPLLKALETAKLDFANEKAIWNEYVSSALQYLTDRMETMDEDSHNLGSLYSALKTVAAAVDAVSTVSVEKKQSRQKPARSPSKPSQKGLKPLRLVQANLSESQEPTSQLLRHLNVGFSDSAQLSKTVNAAIKERKERLHSFSTSTERGISEQVGQSLGRAERNLRPLLSAVYAYSPFGNVNLVDNDIREGIESLEKATQDMGNEMRELDVDGMMRGVEDRQRKFL